MGEEWGDDMVDDETYVNAGTRVYVCEGDLELRDGCWPTANLFVCLDYVHGREGYMSITYTRQTGQKMIRTASAKELREHVEGVGVFVLAALVGFQALLAMTVVYLSFLLPLGQ
jgi:hypothetical protein